MSRPIISTLPMSLKFEWEAEQLVVTASRLRNHTDGRVTGELDIKTTAVSIPSHLHRSLFNFVAPRSRKELATILSHRYAIEWESILEQVCYHTLEHIRRGEPLEELWAEDAIKPVEYLLKPLLSVGQPTIFFGDGATGKSFVALFLTICIELGWTENPLSLELQRVNTLYLDYESETEELHHRAYRLRKGLELPNFKLRYRRCYLPLADDLPQLQLLVAENNIKFLVVDSIGAACGGDLNHPESPLRFFGALRSLKVTSLLLAHTSKDMETKKKTVYGSAYFNNYARSVWEVRKSEDMEADEISVGLFHRKVNISKLQPPLGMKLRFLEEKVEVIPEEVKSVAEFIEHLQTSIRICELLKHGAKTGKELADELALAPSTINVNLFRLKTKKRVVKMAGEKWGLLAKEG